MYIVYQKEKKILLIGNTKGNFYNQRQFILPETVSSSYLLVIIHSSENTNTQQLIFAVLLN